MFVKSVDKTHKWKTFLSTLLLPKSLLCLLNVKWSKQFWSMQSGKFQSVAQNEVHIELRRSGSIQNQLKISLSSWMVNAGEVAPGMETWNGCSTLKRRRRSSGLWSEGNHLLTHHCEHSFLMLCHSEKFLLELSHLFLFNMQALHLVLYGREDGIWVQEVYLWRDCSVRLCSNGASQKGLRGQASKSYWFNCPGRGTESQNEAQKRTQQAAR